MENLDTRLLKILCTDFGATRRGRDKLDILLDDKVDDIGTLDVGQGDIHAKWLVCEVTHLRDLVTDIIQLPRRGFDHAHPACVTDCRSKLRTRDPAHGGLNDRVIRARHLGDAVLDRFS